jgi:hypothetical protein
VSDWEDSFGNKVKNVHAEGTCKGEYCTIHKWSDHHMVKWPMMWRTDRFIMERFCKHGVGHPDPDEIASDKSHTCDGCCTPPEGKETVDNGGTEIPFSTDCECEHCDKFRSFVVKTMLEWAHDDHGDFYDYLKLIQKPKS